MTHNDTAEPAGSAALTELGACPDCQELDEAEAVARAERDASKVTDCRVLRARHLAGSQHNDTGGSQNADAH